MANEFGSLEVEETTKVAAGSLFNEFILPIIDMAPELDFLLLMPAEDLTFEEEPLKSLFHLPDDLSLGLTLGWNYLDGLYSIISGISMIADVDNYRRSQAIAKGLLNIISGAQLFGLTYNPALVGALNLTGATTLAGPAFLTAMFADVVCAGIDYYNANKEVEFEGWLEERLKELAFFDKRIAEVTANSRKHAELVEKRRELLEQVGSRCRVYFADTKDQEQKKRIKDMLEQYCSNENDNVGRHKKTLTANAIINHDDKPSADDRKINKKAAIINYEGEATKADRKLDKQIQESLTKRNEECRNNLITKSLSFFAMSCIFAAVFVPLPPLSIVLMTMGLTIATGVAAYYAVKNAPKIKNIAVGLCHRFFAAKEKELSQEHNRPKFTPPVDLPPYFSPRA